MKPLLLALLLCAAPLAAHNPEPKHGIPHISPDPGDGVAWESPVLMDSGLSTQVDILRARAVERLPFKELLSLGALGLVLLAAWLGDKDLQRREPPRRAPRIREPSPDALRAVLEVQRVHQGH